MSLFKRLIFTFFVLLALSSYIKFFPAYWGNNKEKINSPPKSDWTVMVYMSGDNDLEEYIVKDIENELAATGSTAKVQVIALADRGPDYDKSRDDWQTTKLFHVTKGMLANSQSAIADWGERNMGDKQTLIDFINWSKTNYPAKHYALYFWGHGWNWHPGYVMEDDTDNDSLDMDELRSALPSLGFIDVVGYDGCNMASIEVDFLWHGHATVVSSSQEFVDWSGLDYSKIISSLSSHPEMSADQLAILSTQSATNDKTWSALAVDDRLIPLINALSEWAGYMDENRKSSLKLFDLSIKSTKGFADAPLDKDLYNLAEKISLNTSDKILQERSKALMDAFNGSVLNEHHANEYTNAHGITISVFDKTKNNNSDLDYYLSLDFPMQTKWGGLLNHYTRQ